MEPLISEVKEYLRYTWLQDFAICRYDVASAIQSYGTFMQALVPIDNPYYKYIHKERILYDLFMDDQILAFRYDPKEDSETFYSDNSFDEDSSEAKSFINGVRIMDDYDFRELLMANEYTGGYWDPDIHWIVSRSLLKERKRRLVLKN